ncbi:MAG: tripartite tricarboxylate transporter substrate binding protein [Alphaproteobacteria bacterium]|nr:tripartite tricarboxylate transporter substrate binding protein [Alphaproteobacteria bacterium]
MKKLTLALLAATCVAAAGPAMAQDKYPSKPVRIIVPYAPGGATDITSRLFGEQLKNILGQQVVVESKPGAFGIIAIEQMARSNPDGYTLMVGNVSTNAITPVLFKSKFTLDYEKSVTSVSRLVIYPSFLITTTANFNVGSVKDLVDYAKKNPGKVRYTSAGVGSFPHFDMEVFARRAGADMVHIPNKTGAAGMINDLVVGDAQVAMLNAASGAAMIRAGKLRPIAVLAEQRLKDYPDVPTLAEAGFPGVGTLHWQSMIAPSQTPKPVLDTLFKAIQEAAKAKALQDAFAKQFVAIRPNASLDEAKTWLAGELNNWRKITSEVKIDMN